MFDLFHNRKSYLSDNELRMTTLDRTDAIKRLKEAQQFAEARIEEEVNFVYEKEKSYGRCFFIALFLRRQLFLSTL